MKKSFSFAVVLTIFSLLFSFTADVAIARHAKESEAETIVRLKRTIRSGGEFRHDETAPPEYGEMRQNRRNRETEREIAAAERKARRYQEKMIAAAEAEEKAKTVETAAKKIEEISEKTAKETKKTPDHLEDIKVPTNDSEVDSAAKKKKKIKKARKREKKSVAAPITDTSRSNESVAVGADLSTASAFISAPRPLKRLAVKSQDIGGTLLFSSSPEYVREDGILYRDQVNGEARVLYYHVNETGKAAKVAVVLENKGEMYSVVHITRSGLSAPSSDYLAVGRRTQAIYFGEQKSSTIYLAPGTSCLLAKEMDDTILQNGDLIYGCYDFTTSRTVNVTILLCPQKADAKKFAMRKKIIPPDENHLRGTFGGMTRLISLASPYQPERDQLAYIDIGDDQDDKFSAGIDATDGSIVKNYGNYGILYRLSLNAKKKAAFRCLLSPLGGVYAGAMKVEKTASEPLEIKTPLNGGFFGTKGPNDKAMPFGGRNAYLAPTDEITDLGIYTEKDEAVLEFSPPGASNLPVRIIFLPIDDFDK